MGFENETAQVVRLLSANTVLKGTIHAVPAHFEAFTCIVFR